MAKICVLVSSDVTAQHIVSTTLFVSALQNYDDLYDCFLIRHYMVKVWLGSGTKTTPLRLGNEHGHGCKVKVTQV